MCYIGLQFGFEIRSMSPSGQTVDHQLNEPNATAVDSSGNVYVTYHHQRISVYVPTPTPDEE